MRIMRIGYPIRRPSLPRFHDQPRAAIIAVESTHLPKSWSLVVTDVEKDRP